jgi:hypothetical protein
MKKTIASILAAAYLTTATGFCQEIPKLKGSLEQKTTDYYQQTKKEEKPTFWNHLNPLYTYKNKSKKTNLYIKIGKISAYILLIYAGYNLSKKDEEKPENTESKDDKDNNQDKGRILSMRF